MATNASTTNCQYLNHDWQTQHEMLKIIYDVNTLKVQYLDEENEEIGITNQQDYNHALQFASEHTDNNLKLIIKTTNGTIIGKPVFKIDTNDNDLKKIIYKASVQEEILQTDILANLPNEKQNWLINYLEQLKKDIVEQMETKIKDLVMSQSTVVLNSNEAPAPSSSSSSLLLNKEISNNDTSFILTNLNDGENFEEKIKKLLQILSEAKLAERNIKVAFIDEELQLTGALNALFVKDLTMPDGTKTLPGIKFQKKWLIKNTGKLAWSTESFPVRLVCIAGNITAQNEFVNVEKTEQDCSTTISVELTAPLIPGEYFSEWVLVCEQFQFGPRIWASIEVVSDLNESNPMLSDTLNFTKSSSLSDDLDDEFVVVPDCFDLNKNWKSNKCNDEALNQTNNDLDLSYSINDSLKQNEFNNNNNNNKEQEQEKESTQEVVLDQETKTLSSQSSSSSVSQQSTQPISYIIQPISQPINIVREVIEKPSTNSDLKSPSSFTTTLNLMKDALAVSNNALSNVQMPAYIGDISVSTDNKQEKSENKEQPLISPSVSTISSVSILSKDISSAFGSLGSVYQSSGISSNFQQQQQQQQKISSSKPETIMEKLIQMGFANRLLNNQLLKKHNNDLDKVISSLLEQQESNYRS